MAGSRTMYNTALNVDVGGGTSKLSLIRQGEVVGTAAISVGARLLAFDADGRVDARRGAGAPRAARARAHGRGRRRTRRGDPPRRGPAARRRAVRGPGGRAALAARAGPDGHRAPARLRGPGERRLRGLLGRASPSTSTATRPRASATSGPNWARRSGTASATVGHGSAVRAPTHGIRATVIGAGEYTVQVSGMTSYISDTAALPAFGLKVVRATIRDGESLEASLAASLGPVRSGALRAGRGDRARRAGPAQLSACCAAPRATWRGWSPALTRRARPCSSSSTPTWRSRSAASSRRRLGCPARWSPSTASTWAIWTTSTSGGRWASPNRCPVTVKSLVFPKHA